MRLKFFCGFAYGLTTAVAWGSDGHKIASAVVAKYLDTGVRDFVSNLLDSQDVQQALTLASTYADEIFEEKYCNLHFVQTPDPGCGEYVFERDCEEGECIVSAFRDFAVLLGTHKVEKSARAEALKMLMHLVGDFRQPLHVAFRTMLVGHQYCSNTNLRMIHTFAKTRRPSHYMKYGTT